MDIGNYKAILQWKNCNNDLINNLKIQFASCIAGAHLSNKSHEAWDGLVVCFSLKPSTAADDDGDDPAVVGELIVWWFMATQTLSSGVTGQEDQDYMHMVGGLI